MLAVVAHVYSSVARQSIAAVAPPPPPPPHANPSGGAGARPSAAYGRTRRPGRTREIGRGERDPARRHGKRLDGPLRRRVPRLAGICARVPVLAFKDFSRLRNYVKSLDFWPQVLCVLPQDCRHRVAPQAGPALSGGGRHCAELFRIIPLGWTHPGERGGPPRPHSRSLSQFTWHCTVSTVSARFFDDRKNSKFCHFAIAGAVAVRSGCWPWSRTSAVPSRQSIAAVAPPAPRKSIGGAGARSNAEGGGHSDREGLER